MSKMIETPWVRSHVRLLLQQIWQIDRVEVDADGDAPFRSGSAACWVSVLDGDPVMVRVFAHAAFGVRGSAKLLRELNDLQRSALTARIEFADGVVLVSQTISPIGLTAPVLQQALDSVGGVADDIGMLIASMFDGRTPFPLEVSVDEEAS